MKILVISSLAFSLVNFRGKLLAEMRKQGHEVVAVAGDLDPEVERKLAEMGIALRVIPFTRAGTSLVTEMKTLIAYYRMMRAERPDVILSYTHKPIIYGGIAARVYRRAHYYVLMAGLGYYFGPEGREKKLARGLFVALFREGLRKARKIFVFNADDRTDMLEAGIINRNQDVIQVPGSGVEISHFAAQPLPDGPPRFHMMARFMRDKGVLEFLEAAKQVKALHPETSFALLGRPDTENPTGISEAEVAELAKDYPVEFCPETLDVRPFLGASSVFVLPSYYREGLPRSILEALSVGRPIITADSPGCRDPIEHGKNGFIVPPRDANALALAMLQFIDHPDLISQMAANSRAIAEEVYDVDRVNRILLDNMGLMAA
jgi:glycosyltransferase involved in cell wall biosynthesis